MLSRWRTQAQSWWHQTPLPDVAATEEMPTFQQWHHHIYDNWIPYNKDSQNQSVQHRWSGSLQLVSWNIDAGAPNPGPRMSALLRCVERVCTPDIIFLQEVSRPALKTMLSDSWIRQCWLSSEADESKFGKQKFVTVTLILKSCLDNNPIIPGPIWRIPLPSRLGRDALCCDLLLNSNDRRFNSRVTRVRFINVHLDSLPINPSCRPRQLSIIAKYLGAAKRGLVAGDFNPVLPEDEGLVEKNGLVDAWTKLCTSEPGYTWGVEADQPFPPNRLDKVALYNLDPVSIHVLHPSCHNSEQGDQEPVVMLSVFSDHHGLYSSFNWFEDVEN